MNLRREGFIRAGCVTEMSGQQAVPSIRATFFFNLFFYNPVFEVKSCFSSADLHSIKPLEVFASSEASSWLKGPCWWEGEGNTSTPSPLRAFRSRSREPSAQEDEKVKLGPESCRTAWEQPGSVTTPHFPLRVRTGLQVSFPDSSEGRSAVLFFHPDQHLD